MNHFFYENTFRQFFADQFYTKPQVNESLNIINFSETNMFTIKMSEKNINHINDVYENYILKYIEKRNLKLITSIIKMKILNLTKPGVVF